MTQPGSRPSGRFSHPYRPRPPVLNQSFPPLPAGLVPVQRARRCTPPKAEGPPSPPRNGLGGASLLLAVGGLAFGLVPLAGPVAAACGAAGLVLGALGLRRVCRAAATDRAMCLVGTGSSGLALLLGLWGVALTFGPADATSAPPPTEEAVPPPGRITDGAFEVGGAPGLVAPGTYRTAGPREPGTPTCFWARLRDRSGEFSSVIASGNARGADQVTIEPTDGAFSTSGCHAWIKVR